LEAFGQIGITCRHTQSGMARRTEGAAWDERKVLCLQKSATEGLVILSQTERGAKVQKGIERTLRSEKFNALNPSGHLDDSVSSSLEQRDQAGDAILGTIDRRKSSILTDRRGVAGLVALHTTCRPDDSRGTEDPANTPAGHRIGFTHAIDHKNAIHIGTLDLNGAHHGWRVTERDSPVNLIADEPDASLRGPARNLSDLLGLSHQACGIIGAVDDQGPAPVIKNSFEGLYTGIEAP
jgi:hypothetical protein